MKVSRRFVFPCLAVLVVMGCRSAPSAVSDGVLTVTSRAGVLRLENGSILPINYFVLARDAAPLIDWVPCAGPGCAAIPAHGAVDVPQAQVAGLSAATTEVNTYWWRSVPDGNGGYRADSLRVVIVRL